MTDSLTPKYAVPIVGDAPAVAMHTGSYTTTIRCDSSGSAIELSNLLNRVAANLKRADAAAWQAKLVDQVKENAQ